MCSCIIRFNQNLGFCIIGFQEKKKKNQSYYFSFFLFLKNNANVEISEA